MVRRSLCGCAGGSVTAMWYGGGGSSSAATLAALMLTTACVGGGLVALDACDSSNVSFCSLEICTTDGDRLVRFWLNASNNETKPTASRISRSMIKNTSSSAPTLSCNELMLKKDALPDAVFTPWR